MELIIIKYNFYYRFDSLTESVDEFIDEINQSTEGGEDMDITQDFSDGTTSQKKKRPNGHQILDKLKNSIRSLSEAVEEDNTPVNCIKSLNEVKNVIEKTLSHIETYVKLTINAVYEAVVGSTKLS
jgi:hypothetical protein